MTTIEQALRELADVAETLLTGLKWYGDRHPESVSDADDEAEDEANAALQNARTALAALESAQGGEREAPKNGFTSPRPMPPARPLVEPACRGNGGCCPNNVCQKWIDAASLGVGEARRAQDAADEVQALRDALAVWEGEHCGGDCLAAPCGRCDGTMHSPGKGERLQNALNEAREELAAIKEPAPASGALTEGEKRAQSAAWVAGGGFFQRFDGVDHACMPVPEWRWFLEVARKRAALSTVPSGAPALGEAAPAGLREVVCNLLDTVGQPDPTDKTKWMVKPQQGRAFSLAVIEVKKALASTPSPDAAPYPVQASSGTATALDGEAGTRDAASDLVSQVRRILWGEPPSRHCSREEWIVANLRKLLPEHSV